MLTFSGLVPSLRGVIFTVFAIIVIVLGIGCWSGNDDELSTSTSVISTPKIEFVQPTVLNSPNNPVPTATSIVAMTPTPKVPDSPTSIGAEVTPTVIRMKVPFSGTPELAISDLDATECALDFVSSNGFGGTAPGPTPTITYDRTTPELLDIVSRDSYLRRAHSISENLYLWSENFERLWGYDLSHQQQSAALSILNTNISRLCDAVEILNPDPSLQPVDTLLRESVRSRHAWSSLAIEHLVVLGSSRSEFIDVGRKSTHEIILELQTTLEDLGAAHIAGEVVIELPQLDLRLDLPEQWILGGTERQPLILAPYQLQVIDQQSVDSSTWNFGTAARIRRFRNFGQTTSGESAVKFVGLASSLGDVVSSSSVHMFGVDAVSTRIFNEETDMMFDVLIAVAGDHTIIVDYGCRSQYEIHCDAVADVVAGIEIVDQAS